MSKFIGNSNRISQETFDEVVAENIEEFEMTLQEAVQDAIVQFQKQGVDLSNIDLTGGEGREEMLDALEALRKLSVPVQEVSHALTVISTLCALCDKSHQFFHRNLNLMNEKGGLNDLLLHFDATEDRSIILSVTRFINDLSISSVDLRDFFEPGGSEKLCLLARHFMRLNGSEETSSFLEALLVLARTVSRSENNKNALMKAGAGDIIADLLASNVQSSVLEKACVLIRGLCIHDDLRREMSCAFDNGKFFLKHAVVVPALIKLAGKYQEPSELEDHRRDNITLSSAAFAAAKAFVTTNEAVQILSLHGINDLICKIIRQAAQIASLAEPLPLVLIRSVVGLLRNIVADDGRKDQLISNGILDLLIHILNIDPYCQDGVVLEHGFGCLAQFSLRSPQNSQRIVDSNVAIELLVKSMRKFFDRDGLQRQACLTIRNIAGRCPELRSLLLDSGVESVLRDAGRITTCVDEAYSALRDLGVEVQYVKVTEQGTVMPAYEQFGSTTLNFRPVYDEDDSISTRMNEEARAPFAADSGNISVNYGHDHIHRHHDHDDDCDDCCH